MMNFDNLNLQTAIAAVVTVAVTAAVTVVTG